MANLRGKSTKNVDLVVSAYDNQVARNKKTGEVGNHYVIAQIHPDSPLGQGPDQTLLALNSKRDDKAKSGYDNAIPVSASQFELMKEAAGDNKSPLQTKDGKDVGVNLVFNANLTKATRGPGFAINTSQPMQASELSAAPDADGRDIQTRIFEQQKANKAAKVERDLANKDAEPEVEAEAQTEAVAEAESELGG